ncbi:MAG: DNA adenine methylase [Spirochaetaceae bacterium]
MDLAHPFLTEHIIAYIGNKRRLLRLIYRAIESTSPEPPAGLRFLDLFSGSGVVSRLGKYLNFEVLSNDWEPYSYIINRGLVETGPGDIEAEFGSIDAFGELLEEINTLPDPPEEKRYISKYYAPQSFDIESVDYKTERLFYTRENALAIDKTRSYIEEMYPPGKNDRIRNLLIALLLYEAATHTNTSGVFKAYHKGFGGHGKDAMRRILSPIKLRVPPLIDSDYPVHIFQEDANELVKFPAARGADIVYLDPPYNQHQYGSNYHMLNTIALWDKPPASLELNEKGRLKEKAAIRKDWIETRSDYCYRDTAAAAFSDLLGDIDARHILVSYSTDGIIPFDTMMELCMDRGRVSVISNEYTTYRGGKQSNSRLNTNIEFVLTVNTAERSGINTVKEVDRLIKKRKLYLLFTQKFCRERLEHNSSSVHSREVYFECGGKVLRLPSREGFELSPAPEIEELAEEELELLYEALSSCVCKTREEELGEILRTLRGETPLEDPLYFADLLPETLKKLAHKKNRDGFYRWLGEAKKLEQEWPELYRRIAEKILKVEAIAERRFSD